MKHLVDATTNAIVHENWYAALTMALSMPDICGRLQNPAKKSQQRYEEWFDEYLLPAYQGNVGPGRAPHTFLGASDCYALRCAFLHQGEFGIDDQRAQSVLTHFQFIRPPGNGSIIHCNERKYQGNTVLQLQVDQFCLDVCHGVNNWLISVKNNCDIEARIKKLGHFY